MPKKKKLSLEEFNATAGDDSNEEVDELPSAPEGLRSDEPRRQGGYNHNSGTYKNSGDRFSNDDGERRGYSRKDGDEFRRPGYGDGDRFRERGHDRNRDYDHQSHGFERKGYFSRSPANTADTWIHEGPADEEYVPRSLQGSKRDNSHERGYGSRRGGGYGGRRGAYGDRRGEFDGRTDDRPDQEAPASAPEESRGEQWERRDGYESGRGGGRGRGRGGRGGRGRRGGYGNSGYREGGYGSSSSRWKADTEESWFKE